MIQAVLCLFKIMFYSPHHCVGFLFFAWHPPRRFSVRPPPPSSSQLHFSHLTYHISHHISLLTSLIASHISHQILLITSHSSHHISHLTYHISHHLSLLTSLITSFITSHSSHHNSSQLHFSHLAYHISHHILLITSHSSHHNSSQWAPLGRGFRVASAIHRASWRSCCARGRRLGRGWLPCGSRSTQSHHHIYTFCYWQIFWHSI